ncbi:MAG: hypothetical protein NUV69_03455 [Candidatus Curtissbacteria bacterium]|nr:hypothetical protein [Candidatus Curtissbacteria bacterium]
MFDTYAAEFRINSDIFQPAGLFSDIGSLASDLILILTSIAGVIAVVFIIIGGIRLVTSGGDPKKLSAAGAMITYAVVGLVVTALAFVILKAVQYFLGTNIQF